MYIPIEEYSGDFQMNFDFQLTDKQNNITLMANLMLESFKQNPKASKALKDTGNDKFTHNESKDIWKTTFPMILKDIIGTLEDTYILANKRFGGIKDPIILLPPNEKESIFDIIFNNINSSTTFNLSYPLPLFRMLY